MSKNTTAPQSLAKVDHVAERLGTSRWRVYELAREGVIPSVRLGRALRFDMVAIEQFIRAGGGSNEAA